MYRVMCSICLELVGHSSYSDGHQSTWLGHLERGDTKPCEHPDNLREFVHLFEEEVHHGFVVGLEDWATTGERQLKGETYQESFAELALREKWLPVAELRYNGSNKSIPILLGEET